MSVPFSVFLCLSLPSHATSLQMEKQLPGGPVWLPALDLEKWYQEVMAGFETSSPVSPPSSPPPLPAKAHSSQKPLQVMPCSPCSCMGLQLRPWGPRGATVLGEAYGPGELAGAQLGTGACSSVGPLPPAPLCKGTVWVSSVQGRSGVGAGTDVGAEALSLMWEFAASLFFLTSASLCPGLSCQNGG